MSETDPAAEVLLTERELAERWRCSRGSLANQRSRGEGPPFLKLGVLVRYRLADIASYESDRLVRLNGAA